MSREVRRDLTAEAGVTLIAYETAKGYEVEICLPDATRLLTLCNLALPHLLTALLWIRDTLSGTRPGVSDRAAPPSIPPPSTVDASVTDGQPAFDGLG